MVKSKHLSNQNKLIGEYIGERILVLCIFPNKYNPPSQKAAGIPPAFSALRTARRMAS